MSDNLKEQIIGVLLSTGIIDDAGWRQREGWEMIADKILAIPEIAEALKMKPIQTMRVREPRSTTSSNAQQP